MKNSKIFKITALFFAALMLVSSLFVSNVSAAIEGFEPFHDPTAPRVTDRADILSQTYEEKLAERIANDGALYGIDFVVLTVNGYSASEFGEKVAYYYRYEPGGMAFDDYVADFFDYNGYGLGDNYSGVILGINMDPDDRMYWFITTGEAKDIFEPYISEMKSGIQPLLSAGKYEEAMDYYIGSAENVAKEAALSQKYSFKTETTVNAELVYDNAGILSAADKKLAEETLKKYEAQCGCDFVLLTVKEDFSAADFGPEAEAFYNNRGPVYNLNDYAADFFNSNGFGASEGSEAPCGVIFAICKDENGFNSSCYSAGMIKECGFGLKNEQYQYTKDAGTPSACVEGLVSYIDLIGLLEIDARHNEYSIADLFEKGAGGDAPLVSDNAKVLGDDNVKTLTEKTAKALNDIKTELVILTVVDYAPSEFGPGCIVGYNHGFFGSYFNLTDYAECYLRYHGYGAGDNGDAVILVLYQNNTYKEFAFASTGVKAGSRIPAYKSDDLEDALDLRLNSLFGNTWMKTSEIFITYVRWKMIFGHYPLSFSNVFWSVAIAVAVGLIITMIRTSNSSNPVTRVSPTQYIDNSILNIRDKNEIYIDTTTTRVYIPPSSSGGSSGGGGGHSSGSSGRSHGGGGGRF